MAKEDDDSAVGTDGDESTEVEESSWFERLGQSIVGILFGLVLVVGACGLLFWNEGRAVKTARGLTEGSGVVRDVAADTIDPVNEGKLVHVTGTLTVTGSAVDQEFGVKSPGVLLRRTVEMFQWTEDTESESKSKLGGGQETRTTYKYERKWSNQPVDSSKFRDRRGHINPQMTYRTRSSLASQTKLGTFIVPPDMLYRFGTEESFQATDVQAQALKQRLNKPVQAIDGVLYIGQDASQPAVGDFRITFTHVPLQAASVVAQQAGATFEPYRTRAGGTVSMIKAGQIAATELFKEAQDDNRLWAWLIRGGGFVLMFFGFALIMRPFVVLADVIPILGDIVGAGVGFIALALSLVVAPIVIAIAWFAYRPVVAAVALGVGVALAVGVSWLAKQRKANKTLKGAVAA
jgi:hypothetical protein